MDTRTPPSSNRPDPRAARPGPVGELPPQIPFDRELLLPSVVHLGVGGLQRAHHAVYFDELARRRITPDWGVVRVELCSGEDAGDPGRVEDHCVVVRGPQSDDLRVVEVLADYASSSPSSAAVLDVLAAPSTRLVTLMVDSADPVPVPGAEHSPAAVQAHGYLVQALERRRRGGLPPFTVLSCDELPHNGAVTRSAVLELARRRDPGLASWIEENACFPGSTVDRTEPWTACEDEQPAAGAGTAPVITEPFSQWIVEDHFCDGRPPLEQVGVRFVPSTVPFDCMRMRLLHGAQCALGFLGHLSGSRTTQEAMADPRVRTFVEGFLEEAAAVLLSVPDVDLERYRASVVDRLAGPRTSEPLTRLVRRGSATVPAFVLPSLRQALDQNRPRRHLVLTVAAWLRFLQGSDYAGTAIDLDDARASRLSPLSQAGGTDPRALLAQHDVFGTLGDEVRLGAELHEALELLRQGPLEAAAAIEGPGGPALRPETKEW